MNMSKTEKATSKALLQRASKIRFMTVLLIVLGSGGKYGNPLMYTSLSNNLGTQFKREWAPSGLGREIGGDGPRS